MNRLGQEANRIDFLIEVIWPFHPALSPSRYEIELFRGFTGQLKSRSRLSISPSVFLLATIFLRFILSSSTTVRRKSQQIDLARSSPLHGMENFFHKRSLSSSTYLFFVALLYRLIFHAFVSIGARNEFQKWYAECIKIIIESRNCKWWNV